VAEETQAAVVLRFRDGRTVACSLVKEFSPKEDSIDVLTREGESMSVTIDQLKAVFFLKDPKVREAEHHMGARPESDKLPGNAAAKVEFFDGEIIRGRIEHYSVADHGFYLYPSSPDSNNDRIFVAANALHTLDIEG
jgi:hypothetical protein